MTESRPRIVYLNWPANEISGGIKAAFQHVQMLNDAGIEAAVAAADTSRPAWFETPLPVLELDQVRAGDVLVFPENNMALFHRFRESRQRKVVFCQNPFQAHRGLAGVNSYADFGVTHVICPSHTTLQYCRRRFPELRLGYTPFYVDHEIFAAAPAKTLQVVAVPRKRPLEFGIILDMFRAVYPQYASIDWAYLDQASESQVAQAMGQASVFLSLARLEAHGMTALEAMACGCIVAGFSGVAGGSDSATPRNGFWAAEDDVMACVDQLARAVQLAIDGGPMLAGMIEEGRRTAFEYRREAASQRLLAFWRDAFPDVAPAAA